MDLGNNHLLFHPNGSKALKLWRCHVFCLKFIGMNSIRREKESLFSTHSVRLTQILWIKSPCHVVKSPETGKTWKVTGRTLCKSQPRESDFSQISKVATAQASEAWYKMHVGSNMSKGQSGAKQKDVVYQENPFFNVKMLSNCDKTAATASPKLIFLASLLPPVFLLCPLRQACTSRFLLSSQGRKLIGYGRAIKADWKHFLLEVHETNGRDFTFEISAIQLRCETTVGPL